MTTLREHFRQMDDEYYEAICQWCKDQYEDIDKSYANNLYEALMQLILCEATEHIEEFWHKVAMNYPMSEKDVKYYSEEPCKLWRKFPHGKTYMPCIEELYHKYEMDEALLLDNIDVYKVNGKEGYAGICPVCKRGHDVTKGIFMILEGRATCLHDGCTMNRKYYCKHDGEDVHSNSCHVSYLVHKLQLKHEPASI